MMEWLQANGGTLLVLALVTLAVVLVIRKQIRDKRAGRTSCGNNCAHCAMHGSCHQAEQK